MTIAKVLPLARTAVIALAIGASALITATVAEACACGDHFLDTLESHGINADPASAFELADAVCSSLAEGEAYDALIDQGIADTGLSAGDFTFVVEQSVVFFCPESTQKLPS